MDSTLPKLIFVLLTAPWWFPVLRRVVTELWEQARIHEDDLAPEDPARRPDMHSVTSGPQRRRNQRGVWARQGTVWSKRRWINPLWDTGHRAVARPQEAERRSGFGPHRPSQVRTGMRRRRFEGGFGRRGL